MQYCNALSTFNKPTPVSSACMYVCANVWHGYSALLSIWYYGLIICFILVIYKTIRYTYIKKNFWKKLVIYFTVCGLCTHIAQC